MALSYTQNISENECMGDSLSKINNNFTNLDTGVTTLSTSLVNEYNTLIRALTAVGSPGTTYESLSTIFKDLSAYILH